MPSSTKKKAPVTQGQIDLAKDNLTKAKLGKHETALRDKALAEGDLETAEDMELPF
jgi:hypothetical protein